MQRRLNRIVLLVRGNLPNDFKSESTLNIFEFAALLRKNCTAANRCRDEMGGVLNGRCGELNPGEEYKKETNITQNRTLKVFI